MTINNLALKATHFARFCAIMVNFFSSKKKRVLIESIPNAAPATDGERVILPRYTPEEISEKGDLILAFIIHEGSHIKYSDFQAIEKNVKTLQEYFRGKGNIPCAYLNNSIEDWYIESKVTNEFPKTRKFLVEKTIRLAREMREMNQGISKPQKMWHYLHCHSMLKVHGADNLQELLNQLFIDSGLYDPEEITLFSTMFAQCYIPNVDFEKIFKTTSEERIVIAEKVGDAILAFMQEKMQQEQEESPSQNQNDSESKEEDDSLASDESSDSTTTNRQQPDPEGSEPGESGSTQDSQEQTGASASSEGIEEPDNDLNNSDSSEDQNSSESSPQPEANDISGENEEDPSSGGHSDGSQNGEGDSSPETEAESTGNDNKNSGSGDNESNGPEDEGPNNPANGSSDGAGNGAENEGEDDFEEDVENQSSEKSSGTSVSDSNGDSAEGEEVDPESGEENSEGDDPSGDQSKIVEGPLSGGSEEEGSDKSSSDSSGTGNESAPNANPQKSGGIISYFPDNSDEEIDPDMEGNLQKAAISKSELPINDDSTREYRQNVFLSSPLSADHWDFDSQSSANILTDPSPFFRELRLKNDRLIISAITEMQPNYNRIRIDLDNIVNEARDAVWISDRKGKIDSRHLYRGALKNPFIFKHKEEGEEKSIDFVLLVDFSSSTGENSIYAQFAALAYILTKAIVSIDGYRVAVIGYNSHLFQIKNFDSDLVQMGKYTSLTPEGLTNTEAALNAAHRILMSSDATAKLVINITDGFPNDFMAAYEMEKFINSHPDMKSLTYILAPQGVSDEVQQAYYKIFAHPKIEKNVQSIGKHIFDLLKQI